MTFAADDWRSKSPIFHGEPFQRNLAVVEQLKHLTEREGMSVAQLAIAWVLAQPHCLTGNLPLSASSISFPSTLHCSFLQGRNVAHQLWSGRRTWRPLERMKKMFHEATRGRSLSPRPLLVFEGGERGTVLELSSKTRVALTNCPSVP
jgi:hypothetical protein